MNATRLAVSAIALAAAAGAAESARPDQIAGSSTVLPYATIVAEAFGENFDFPTPVVEGGGGSRRRPQETLRGRGREHDRHRQFLLAGSSSPTSTFAPRTV